MNDLLLKTPRLLQGDFFAINKEMGFPGGSDGKASVCSARDLGLIPGGEDPLEKEMAIQYSCLENPMDRGAWWAAVHEVAESDTTSLSPSLLP